MKSSGEDIAVDVEDEMIQWISIQKNVRTPVTKESYLYVDLGFDSLSFIRFLIEIEKRYEISFEIAEMESCLHVGTLIDQVENKIRGKIQNDTATAERL